MWVVTSNSKLLLNKLVLNVLIREWRTAISYDFERLVARPDMNFTSRPLGARFKISEF